MTTLYQTPSRSAARDLERTTSELSKTLAASAVGCFPFVSVVVKRFALQRPIHRRRVGKKNIRREA